MRTLPARAGQPDRAVRQMVVDDAARLHQRVQRRRADEAEPAALEVLRERDGLGRLRRHLGPRLRRCVARGRAVALPDQLVQAGAVVVQVHSRARVGDRRLDLRAVADDARVGEQAGHVVVAEARHGGRLEARERGAEPLALAQDRDPREARLERLERHALEQPTLVGDRPAPLLVVVALVERVAVAEAARHGRPAAMRCARSTAPTTSSGAAMPRNVKSLSSVPAVSKSTVPTRRTRSMKRCLVLTFWMRSIRVCRTFFARMPRRMRSRCVATTWCVGIALSRPPTMTRALPATATIEPITEPAMR